MGTGGSMKIDLYTKVILSVIAASLLVLAIASLTPAVSAQADVQRVVVTGWERALPVLIVDEQGQVLSGAQGMRVNVGSQPVPVTLRAIERSGSWQPITVDVLKAPPSSRPGP